MSDQILNIDRKDFETLKNLILDIPAKYVLKTISCLNLIETKDKLNKAVAEQKLQNKALRPYEGPSAIGTGPIPGFEMKEDSARLPLEGRIFKSNDVELSNTSDDNEPF